MIAEQTVNRVARQSRLTAASIRPIAVPLWLGAERPGVDLGAGALETGLGSRWQRTGRDDLLARLQPAVAVDAPNPVDAADRLHRRSLEFLAEVVATCDAVADEVASATARGEVPVVLGGDHAVAAGSLAGVALTAEQIGVLWLDSHADLNTPETSPSGHIHGMALASALGVGPNTLVDIGRPGPKVAPADVCLLGIRDVDAGERALIAREGIWMLTMEEWTDVGLLPGLEAALSHLTRRGVDAVHLSLDLDVLDPTVLPGTGTAVPGGLTYREASQLLRRLRTWHGPLHSVDWVELNPSLDPSGRSTDVAVALLATLLGETAR